MPDTQTKSLGYRPRIALIVTATNQTVTWLLSDVITNSMTFTKFPWRRHQFHDEYLHSPRRGNVYCLLWPFCCHGCRNVYNHKLQLEIVQKFRLKAINMVSNSVVVSLSTESGLQTSGGSWSWFPMENKYRSRSLDLQWRIYTLYMNKFWTSPSPPIFTVGNIICGKVMFSQASRLKLGVWCVPFCIPLILRRFVGSSKCMFHFCKPSNFLITMTSLGSEGGGGGEFPPCTKFSSIILEISSPFTITVKHHIDHYKTHFVLIFLPTGHR